VTRTLVLTEYRASDPMPLSTVERDTLKQLVPELVIQPAPGSTETYTLTGGSTVGVVRVGDLTVELRPKIDVAPVLFLLSYALDLRAWRDEHASLTHDVNLAEAIVPLFARTAQDALRPGLLHGYREHEDTLTTVRGRVRIAEQFRAHRGLPLPVEVIYDDFTPDILENRLLRTAVDVLGRLHLRHLASRTALTRLHQQLNGISMLMADTRGVPEPHWTRLNERYRPAVGLARLIITTVGLQARSGRQDASAFLVNMNAVFEQFIRTALREQLRLDTRAFPAGATGRDVRLDVEGHVRLEPDLSWWVHDRCVFVGDCKYKRTVGAIPNADVYQLLAYLTALDLSEGLLVYAAGQNVPHDVLIRHAGRRIHVRTVNVAQAPRDVLSDIAALVADVHAMADRNTST
jgi:5-methylcytosine-specific restriction enzyme subunit McrC